MPDGREPGHEPHQDAVGPGFERDGIPGGVSSGGFQGEFEGEFEIHLTVEAHDHASMDALSCHADLHGMKFVRIVLPRGAVPSQPMLSWRARGRLSEQRCSAALAAERLRAAGIRVMRTKIEAAPSNRDVPQSGACAQVEHYFECHLKLLLDERADIASVAELALAHGAHLSRNARRMRDDRRQERFATLRRRSGGADAITQDAAALAALLAGSPLCQVVSTEIEYVVYDSAPAVDDGWLPGGVR